MEAIKPKYHYVREGETREKRRYNNAFYFNLHGEKVECANYYLKTHWALQIVLSVQY